MKITLADCPAGTILIRDHVTYVRIADDASRRLEGMLLRAYDGECCIGHKWLMKMNW